MIIAKKSDGIGFAPAPTGTHPAVLVDVIDLGRLPNSFAKPGQAATVHKIRLVWQLAECLPGSNRRYTVGRLYTLSLHERSTLRKHLDAWIGPLSPTQLAGFDLEEMIDCACLLSIVHNDRDGATWANVEAVMRLPRGMAVPEPDGYVRKKDRPAEPADELEEEAVSEFADYDAAPPSQAELYANWKASGR
jgi:hypothetical protein